MEAIDRFLKNAQEDPDKLQHRFLLGISYFLTHQAKPAISTLKEADSLSKGALKIEIRWYLAQAYLLNNDPEEATPYLEWIIDKPGEYAEKARKLLNHIKEPLKK